MTLPDTLNCDSAPYPSDAVLEQIKAAHAWGPEGARWMVKTFPTLAKELAPYAVCDVTLDKDHWGGPEYLIRFSTQGWSGCEDFIQAVLSNTILRLMYYSAWSRGGHYEFRVPRKALAPIRPERKE